MSSVESLVLVTTFTKSLNLAPACSRWKSQLSLVDLYSSQPPTYFALVPTCQLQPWTERAFPKIVNTGVIPTERGSPVVKETRLPLYLV